MYCRPGPTDFQNNCKICCSLDYDITDKNICKQKFKKKVKKPFKMSRLPFHLLNSILTKMYYKGFMRFRQTNKLYAEYVDRNRDHLRIAWFHDKKIEFTVLQGEAEPTLPYIWLANGPFRTLCRQDSKEPNLRYGDNTPAKRSILDRLRGISYFQITRGQRIYLHDLEENEEMRRELTGCYIPVTLSVNDTNYGELPEAEWASFCSRFDDFLHWLGLKERKITFENSTLNPVRVFEICSMIRAQTLFLRYLHLDNNQNTSFKHAEVVCLIRSRIPNNVFTVFPKIKSLETNLEIPVKNCDLEAIVKEWISGTGTLKYIDLEMDVTDQNEIFDFFEDLSSDGHVTVLKSLEALKILKQRFPYYHLFESHKEDGKAFLLKRVSDGKKAICTMSPSINYWSMEIRMILEHV